jgi:NAD(P)H-flavin reductase
MTCRLESVTDLSRDTARYRFATPRPLNSTPMAHVLAVDAGNILRPYTPVAESDTSFDIVVRRYAGGYFSDKFAQLKVGEAMAFKGPEPTLPYAPNAFDCVSFVCGGTGAAPAVQLLRAALADDTDTTRFRVLYLSRTKSDQTLKRDLDALKCDRLDLLCACDDVDGLVDATMLRRCLPAPSDTKSAVLVSGPPGLVRRLCGTNDRRAPLGGLLAEMGYGAQVARLD